jgi:DNA-binding HxlR family transcriptional regulator
VLTEVVMRSYGEACTMAHALDLVGDRWALLLVRELLFGPRRFTDLQRALPRANSRILAQRLRELTGTGVLRRRRLAPPAGSNVYELTDWGADLEPVILHLGRWGSRSPHLNVDGDVSAVSAMIALRARASPAGLTAELVVRFGEDHFTVRVTDGRIQVTRDAAAEPDAVVDTDALTFAALITRRLALSAATESGRLRLTGASAPVEQLFGSIDSVA